MADFATCPPLTRHSVVAAASLIASHIHTTPVLTNTTLTSLASTPQAASSLENTPWSKQKPSSPTIRLYFKCENLQRIGAFKIRGAFHALTRLRAASSDSTWSDICSAGVITHSSGNHAQALALAAKEMGIPATIVMPTISTPNKIAATKGYGARVVFSGSTSKEREAVVKSLMEEQESMVFVPPYDHPDIMLGQGTAGLEFQRQAEEMIAAAGMAGSKQMKCSFAKGAKDDSGSKPCKGLNAIITPCGGGGLLSGTAISCQGTGIRVFGSEPEFEGADDCKRGLANGARIETVRTLTIADGLRTPVGVHPWSIISNPKFVQGVYSVTEEQIKKAMRLVLERMKLVIEPSSAVPLAVTLFNEDFRAMVEREAGTEGWDLGVVFSGGNVSVEALGKMFEVQIREAQRQEGVIGADGSKVVENVAG